jgi:hypothetical protein
MFETLTLLQMRYVCRLSHALRCSWRAGVEPRTCIIPTRLVAASYGLRKHATTNSKGMHAKLYQGKHHALRLQSDTNLENK